MSNEKPYEIFGVPEKPYFIDETPPSYASVLELNDENRPNFCETDRLKYKKKLWGKASYWTAIEAALLLSGIDPSDEDLYLVGVEDVSDHDTLTNKHYEFKYAFQMTHAIDYLFLFERSELFPKAEPIKWYKYFKLNIDSTDIQAPYKLDFSRQWGEFFGLAVDEAHINVSVSSREKNSLLRIIAAMTETLVNPSADGKSPLFSSQAELISFLEDRYDGYEGLKKSTLEDKIALGNKLLKNIK